jgi:membrane protease YdiL (CAAX protease family)
VLNEGGPDIVALKVALVVGLAPVSEELFFRGWLWEAFRRRGLAIFTTACLTSLPWLLLHGLDAPGRILFLIPAAVVISFARHLGHSVFASLAVHVANNGAAMLLQVLTEGVGAR